MDYLTRTLDREQDGLLRGAGAISIDGATGVDETDTATRRARQAWSLDAAGQREHLRADLSLDTIAPNGSSLFDQWQQLPQ